MDLENVETEPKKIAKPDDLEESVDFETAISATGHGLFNYVLLLVTMFACIATVFETSTMSYILPSAECDLKLTLVDKGLLNAITYAGMISSAIFWGFLADTLGRRKLLVIGFLANAVCDIFGSLSLNIHYLMTFKFLGGFVICGPFAVLMAYVTEFHGIKHRPRTMMCIGFFFCVSTLVLPLIAYCILPQKWQFYIFKLKIPSWKIFLMVCALPTLISGIAFMFLPESPKYHMTTGHNEKALLTFRRIFAMNMRKNKDEYPIKKLISETEQKPSKLEGRDSSNTNKDRWKEIYIILQNGLQQLKPLFKKPYLGYSLHVYTIQFCTLLGLNTLRLWLPQLFAVIANSESAADGRSENICGVLSRSMQENSGSRYLTECTVSININMYYNQMIVAVTGIASYFMAGVLINALGNKTLLILALFLSGTSGICMIWTTTSTAATVVSSLYVALGSLGSTTLLATVVNLFPTSYRTMTVSLAMMFGRLGALIGNILFPLLLEAGCTGPFLMIGLAMFVSSGLSIFLPSTSKKPLE